MELIVNFQKLQPIESNFESLKKELEVKLEKYQNLVVIESEIQSYKNDRATLNLLKKAIDEERKKIKKEYSLPIAEFEAQVKQLTEMIDQPILCLDLQLKKFEQAKKDKKREEIENLFNSINTLEKLSLGFVFQESWLNVTKSMKSIEEEIKNTLNKINEDIDFIDQYSPDHKDYMFSVYYKTFKLADALNEKKRIEDIEKLKKEREEQQKKLEVKQTEQTTLKTNEELQQIDFRVWVDSEQKAALRNFFISNNIKYGKVE